VGSLRIIAGAQRGRRLSVPRGAAVRPTADRAREALFSILGARVRRARVLDAYAGSGALGLEALSRGAAAATFLEADREALRVVRANAAHLGVEASCTFRLGRAIDLLRRGEVAGPFDLVLADPPYDSGERDVFLARVGEVVTADGVIVLERDARREAARAGHVACWRTARYGRCRLDFYRRSEEGTREDPGATGSSGPPDGAG
jgi:16S rRNA (guanine(966)-N(2))-methyltransferase RsmD